MAQVMTDAAVQRYKPGAARRIIRDAKATSLYLVVQPSGHKSWMMRFRRNGGAAAKIVLGPVDASGRESAGEPTIGMPLTLAGARQLAAQVHRDRAMGRDPIADHRLRKQRAAVPAGAANTFGVAAADFVQQYASKKVRRWKEQARLLGLDPEGLTPISDGLATRWASRPVAEITGHDIHALVAETRERGAPGLERRSDGPTESRARAMLSCLSRMFRWLLQHRRVDTNPCAGVHRPDTPQARDRVLTDAEIVRFWTATDTVGERLGALLRLLLLMGSRLNEVAQMTRAELSDDTATWTLPAARTKNRRAHVVPLPPLARDILQGVRTIEGCPFVFSTNGRTPVSGWSKCKRRLDAAMGAIPVWRLHDLRRTCATGMAEIGIAPHIVEACLNHVSGAKASVAGIYNRAAYMPERRAALERWATHVHGLVAGRPAKITPLRPRSA